MDDDLKGMVREELEEEIIRLREGIRQHRDSSGHDLCWFHPDLWNLLPEQKDAPITIPAWPQFMRGCVAYRQSLERELPDAPVEPNEYEP